MKRKLRYLFFHNIWQVCKLHQNHATNKLLNYNSGILEHILGHISGKMRLTTYCWNNWWGLRGQNSKNNYCWFLKLCSKIVCRGLRPLLLLITPTHPQYHPHLGIKVLDFQFFTWSFQYHNFTIKYNEG